MAGESDIGSVSVRTGDAQEQIEKVTDGLKEMGEAAQSATDQGSAGMQAYTKSLVDTTASQEQLAVAQKAFDETLAASVAATARANIAAKEQTAARRVEAKLAGQLTAAGEKRNAMIQNEQLAFEALRAAQSSGSESEENLLKLKREHEKIQRRREKQEQKATDIARQHAEALEQLKQAKQEQEAADKAMASAAGDVRIAEMKLKQELRSSTETLKEAEHATQRLAQARDRAVGKSGGGGGGGGGRRGRSGGNDEDSLDFDSNNMTRALNLIKASTSKGFDTIFRFAAFNGLSKIMREFTKRCNENAAALKKQGVAAQGAAKATMFFQSIAAKGVAAIKSFGISLALDTLAVYVFGKAVTWCWEKISGWWNAAKKKAEQLAEANKKLAESMKEVEERSQQRIESLKTPGEKMNDDIRERNLLLGENLKILDRQKKAESELSEIMGRRSAIVEEMEHSGGAQQKIQKLNAEMIAIERSLGRRRGATSRYEDTHQGISSEDLRRRQAELNREAAEIRSTYGLSDPNSLSSKDIPLEKMLKRIDDEATAKKEEIAKYNVIYDAKYAARELVNAFRGIVPNSAEESAEEVYADAMKRWNQQVEAAAATLDLMKKNGNVAAEALEEFCETTQKAQEASKVAIEKQYADAIRAADESLRRKMIGEIEDGMGRSTQKSPTASAVERLDAIERYVKATGNTSQQREMMEWTRDQFSQSGPFGEITKAMERQATAADRASEAIRQVEEGFSAGVLNAQQRIDMFGQISDFLKSEQEKANADADAKSEGSKDGERSIAAYLKESVEAYRAEISGSKRKTDDRVASGVERGNRISEETKKTLEEIQRYLQIIAGREDMVVV